MKTKAEIALLALVVTGSVIAQTTGAESIAREYIFDLPVTHETVCLSFVGKT